MKNFNQKDEKKNLPVSKSTNVFSKEDNLFWKFGNHAFSNAHLEGTQAEMTIIHEMVEKLPSGVLLIENNKLYLNEQLEKIIEYSNKEISELDQWFKVLFEDKAFEMKAKFEHEKHLGYRNTFEVRARAKSGIIKQLEIAGRTFQDAIVLLIRDISDFAKAREEINLQADTLDNSINSFFIINPDGEFIYVNKAYLRNWGFKNRKEIVGKSFKDHLSSPAKAKQIISKVQKEGKITQEFTAKRKDGSYFEILLSAYLYKSGFNTELIAGSSIDITEQKKNLKELNIYKNHLEVLVNERTMELGKKNDQLERMNNLFIGREFRIKELRDQVKGLKEKLNFYEDI